MWKGWYLVEKTYLQYADQYSSIRSPHVGYATKIIQNTDLHLHSYTQYLQNIT